MRRTRKLLLGTLAAGLASPAAAAAAPHVLRVGSFKGVPGQFQTIQAAVDHAKPNDWILIGPGDHKTTTDRAPAGQANEPAGVLVTTPGLWIRGMNRNTTIVDGTKPGSPACSNAQSAQNFGPTVNGKAQGLNGFEVYKADNVWIQNLTACNFLGGAGNAGNEIWWNGGDGSYKIGGWGYNGSFLNATSSYFSGESTAAAYGIFSSNWDGGTWNQTYASNMNDSGYYIGACQQQCNQTVNHAWGEFNALGYSGSNSGGMLVVKNSQFDQNQDGFDTNSQNGDEPSPQNGACPNGGISPITHTDSCWVFMHNYVHDNNNPNVPSAGLAASGPDGTGMSISGGRNDTVMDNVFANNHAWGVIVVPFPDSSGAPCIGGTMNSPTPGSCLFDDWGDHVVGNTFTNNGGFKNPSNGDIAWLNFESGHPTPCFSANTDTGGPLTTSPSNLQSTHPTCTGKPEPANDNPTFLLQVSCDSGVQIVPGVSTCGISSYPRQTSVPMHPLPTSQLPTMPRVCGGVPVDPWCNNTVYRVHRCVSGAIRVPLVTALGQRISSLRVRRNGYRQRHFRRTHMTLRVAWSSAKTARIFVVEKVKVHGHRETIRFTRIYKHC